MIGLQKLPAQAGSARPTVEEWIRAGRLTVGGRTARLGERASPAAGIRLDGRKLSLGVAPHGPELLLYYKAVGEVTTHRDRTRSSGSPVATRAATALAGGRVRGEPVSRLLRFRYGPLERAARYLKPGGAGGGACGARAAAPGSGPKP